MDLNSDFKKKRTDSKSDYKRKDDERKPFRESRTKKVWVNESASAKKKIKKRK
jgi:hypothetical protein